MLAMLTPILIELAVKLGLNVVERKLEPISKGDLLGLPCIEETVE